MRILFFSDIHFHHTHRFSHITPEGYTIRELEHLSCADTIVDICNKENIDKIVFGGDAWGPVTDTMSCQTLNAMIDFFKKISDCKPVDIIVGNHDLSGNTNNKYAHKLATFKYWNNINVYEYPTVVGDFIYMPYCDNDETAESFLKKIENKQDKIVFSHLEINNTDLGNNIFTTRGVDLDVLKQFKMTLQGHYHSAVNPAKNVQISGSTQRLSFKDKGIARKNIIIYDTETNKVKRESFNCPDWLTFTDDNIESILNYSNDNYFKVDITTDILLTDEIHNKLNNVKGKEIHIDLMRISTNKKVEEEITVENNSDILIQFINKSNNDTLQKEDLIKKGNDLLERV
ncbi:MAG: exonuclease SbcCD subunit D [Succinivibrionaceae bacterium]